MSNQNNVQDLDNQILRQMLQDFLEEALELLDQLNLNLIQLESEPENVELEITETFLVSDKKRIQKQLENIKKLGFKLALDDFGKGYSSLGYLKNFPIDTIKIDREFIENNHKNPKNKAIIKTIIEIGHEFGYKIVAEGIEKIEEMDILYRKECDECQGFYFSKPINKYEFLNLLRAENN